jgi:hypothetical protein
MADKKISALTSASTPLAGTEVLPIVQSGATVKVSVENVLTSIQPSGIANSVVYLNGSKVATTGGVLLFDGTNLGVGTTPAYRADVVSPAGAQNIFRAGQSGVSNGLTISSTGSALSYQFDTGNIVIGTSGKGIDFSATAGTGTSELLADYEEGTWTPVVSGTGTAGTYQIGTNGSTYTKIGRTVTLQGFIQFAAVVTGGGTGSLQITGLPFTKTANSYPAGSVYLATGVYVGISPIVVFGSFSASSQLLLQQNASGGFGTAVGIGFASANAYLAFTLSYEV